MRSIENMMSNKKKITIYFGFELLGYYRPSKKFYNVKTIIQAMITILKEQEKSKTWVIKLNEFNNLGKFKNVIKKCK